MENKILSEKKRLPLPDFKEFMGQFKSKGEGLAKYFGTVKEVLKKIKNESDAVDETPKKKTKKN